MKPYSSYGHNATIPVIAAPMMSPSQNESVMIIAI